MVWHKKLSITHEFESPKMIQQLTNKKYSSQYSVAG